MRAGAFERYNVSGPCRYLEHIFSTCINFFWDILNFPIEIRIFQTHPALMVVRRINEKISSMYENSGKKQTIPRCFFEPCFSSVKVSTIDVLSYNVFP